MAIKLIALDIDGTLTGNSENTVGAHNMEEIRRAQEAGVFVTIATGRSSFATRTFWQQLSIAGPSIQYGGAWTVDTRTDERIDSRPLAPEVVREVMRYARDTGAAAHLYQDDIVYTGQANPYSCAYVGKNGMPFVIDPDICEKLYENVPKVLVFSREGEETALWTRFSERFAGVAHVTRSQSTFVEINDFSATKGQALKSLAERMGFRREEVAAVGDSYLDLDMIEWAGTGVCVASGVPEAQAVADVIAPACEDDGVADFIERYVL